MNNLKMSATSTKNINNLNTNDSDDSAQKNDDFDEIYNKLLYTRRICFAIRFKDKNKINRELWWFFYYSNGLNVNNFVKKELDRKYPGEYVYIFKLNNNYFKIKFFRGKIKVLSAHKDN